MFSYINSCQFINVLVATNSLNHKNYIFINRLMLKPNKFSLATVKNSIPMIGYQAFFKP